MTIHGLTPTDYDPDVYARSCAEFLEARSDYRVLKQFVPRASYGEELWNLGEPAPTRLGLYVDVEATGLDTEHDEIIELAMVPFVYEPTRGVVFEVRPSITFLEEPTHRTISAEITDLTHITPEMVAGHRIVDTLVDSILDSVSLVIAHNADYDRRMLERRLPLFAERPWACSQKEVPWKKFGVNGGALGNILMSACGEFSEGTHRAAEDCHIGIHVLAAATLDSRSALSLLLESARQPTQRVCAHGSPMSAKATLRARGYRAMYDGPRFAYWYKDLRDDGTNVEAELTWCRDEAFAEPDLTQLTAKDRYSVRSNP